MFRASSRRFGLRWRSRLAALLPSALLACQEPPPPPKPLTRVEVQPVTMTKQSPSVTLTGEIAAQVENNLGFRFAGRIAKRDVEVGDHVERGQVLATLETEEQEADVRSAEAGVQSAEATLRQVQATFERQEALLADGNTTRANFDNAARDLQSAVAALDRTKADLGTARDNLANATLKADAAGIVTQRNAEAGQVVEAAQTVFTVAQDGPRDALFEVYEGLLTKPPADGTIEISLLSDPSIKTVGMIREISPVIDPSTGTVQAKIGLRDLPPGMGLGAPVLGLGRFAAADAFVVPWTALTVENDKPAVWVVDPASAKASPRPVAVQSYRTNEVLLGDGLKAGDLVVTVGMQLLRPGEAVDAQRTAGGSDGSAKP